MHSSLSPSAMTALNRQQAVALVVSALIHLLCVAPCTSFTPPSATSRVAALFHQAPSSLLLPLSSSASPKTHRLASRLGDVMDDELGKSFMMGGFNVDNDNDDDINDDDDDNKIDDYSDEELLAMAGDWDETVPQFNTIHLSGRVGNDPEARYFDDGKVVVNLSLAVTRKYHSQERKAMKIKFGEEETDWYSLEIWGQTAEFVNKFVDKGMRVGIIGSLETDEWNDKQTGERRIKPRVVVRDFNILETRAEAEARRGRDRTGNSSSSSSRRRSFYKGDDSKNDDDDDDDYYGGPVSAGSGSGFF